MKRRRHHKSPPGEEDNRRRKPEIEHLKGIIREQDKQIKQLQRQLKYYEKRTDPNKDRKEETTIKPYGEPLEQKKLIPCEECGKGFYEEFEILGRVYGTCNISACGDRMRLK